MNACGLVTSWTRWRSIGQDGRGARVLGDDVVVPDLLDERARACPRRWSVPAAGACRGRLVHGASTVGDEPRLPGRHRPGPAPDPGPPRCRDRVQDAGPVDASPRKPARLRGPDAGMSSRGRATEPSLGTFGTDRDRRHVAVVDHDGRSPRARADRDSGLVDVSLLAFFARSLGLMAFSGSLPAPGGRTEGRGGTSARRDDHRRPKGPSPGGEGLVVSATRIRDRTRAPDHEGDDDDADEGRADAGAAARPRRRRPRRSHVPADGSAARRGRRAGPQGDAPRGDATLKRTRIGADVAVRGAPPPGRRRLLQLPGRRHPAALRRPRRLPGAAPHPRPPRAGRRPRRRRLRPGHRQGRRLHGHLRARAPRTSSPASAPPCSTRCRWSRSPATCPPRSSARTPSRRSTSPASPCR